MLREGAGRIESVDWCPKKDTVGLDYGSPESFPTGGKISRVENWLFPVALKSVKLVRR